MDDKDRLRLIIREAVFQHIDFGKGAPAATATVDAQDMGQPEEKSQTDIKSTSPGKSDGPIIFNPDDKLRQSKFKVVKDKVMRFNKSYYSKRGFGKDKIANFTKEFGDLNNNFNKAAEAIRKRKRANLEPNRRDMAYIEKYSNNMYEDLRMNAPMALKDRDVVAWYNFGKFGR